MSNQQQSIGISHLPCKTLYNKKNIKHGTLINRVNQDVEM